MYLTRKDLLDRKWELADIQAFAHDQTKKSETGRGRPSYLYLVSRVEQKEKGLTIDMSEMDKAATLARVTGSVSATVYTEVVNKLPCSVPQPICEPKPSAPESSAMFVPYVQVNGTVELAKPKRPIENPDAIKIDRKSLPKGTINVILRDDQGNETLADLNASRADAA